MLQNANILLVFSSLCFLFPSILSFYKAHYIHSVLCFQSSIISTMYWSNTENKQMLVYDKVAARLASIYWLMFSSIQQHKYAKQICAFYVISAISYIASNQLSTIKLRPKYWVLVHFLFHMSTITGGCIYFLFLN
jgi:hypothetical protein